MEAGKLGFGCMRLPLMEKEDTGKIDLRQMEKMVDYFLEQGFTYFDTAYMYHNYESENAVRQGLVERHPRESFTLATKMPVKFVKSPEDVPRFFEEQLVKTGVTYFDYYLCHNLNRNNYKIAEENQVLPYLVKQKEKGRIKQLGFSFHDTPEVLETILKDHPELDFVQLQLNYLDWDNRGIQSGKCYQVAEKYGKPVIVMEPVKGGTLAKIPEEAEKILKGIHPDLSVASWAIRYVASKSNVMMVLSGMSDLDQVKDNTSYMKNFHPLTGEEEEAILKVVSIIHDSISIGCTGCRYCVEGCPEKIPIPEYFALYNAEKQSLNRGFSTQIGYYRNLAQNHGKASDCVQCGQCEKSCPQHLLIRDALKDVAKCFE